MQENLDINFNISDRISYIIDNERINVSELSRKLGYERSQNLNDYKSGKAKPTFDFFSKFISSGFSEKYNLIWLISGNGPILNSNYISDKNSNNNDRLVEQKPKSTSMNEVALLERPLEESIAYYNEYASAGLMMGIAEGKTTPDAYINVPGLNDCDMAINVYGESMTPIYQPGQIAICKKVPVDPQLSYVRYGEAYLAICDDGPVIKYIRKSDDRDYLVFASANEDYEPYLVHKSRIQDLYLIKGVVARKNL